MAADRHDMTAFYGGLKAVYGPRALGPAPFKSTDGTLLTDRPRILKHWVEHFQSVLNQIFNFRHPGALRNPTMANCNTSR